MEDVLVGQEGLQHLVVMICLRQQKLNKSCPCLERKDRGRWPASLKPQNPLRTGKQNTGPLFQTSI